MRLDEPLDGKIGNMEYTVRSGEPVIVSFTISREKNGKKQDLSIATGALLFPQKEHEMIAAASGEMPTVFRPDEASIFRIGETPFRMVVKSVPDNNNIVTISYSIPRGARPNREKELQALSVLPEHMREKNIISAEEAARFGCIIAEKFPQDSE